MENVGKLLYGYCNGYFGRDDYATKIIVFETPLAICCRYIDEKELYLGDSWSGVDKRDLLTGANFKTIKEKQDCIDEWSSEKARKDNDNVI